MGRNKNELLVAVEGMYSGQSIYAGKKAALSIGNIVPVGQMPEGTIACNLERNIGDRGRIARSSGTSVQILAHIDGLTRIEHPLLKAGRAYYKFKAKRNRWPKVRGVAMNRVDHPHGGGNHQHIGSPSTVSRNCPPGRKVGLIAARRTGLKK